MPELCEGASRPQPWQWCSTGYRTPPATGSNRAGEPPPIRNSVRDVWMSWSSTSLVVKTHQAVARRLCEEDSWDSLPRIHRIHLTENLRRRESNANGYWRVRAQTIRYIRHIRHVRNLATRYTSEASDAIQGVTAWQRSVVAFHRHSRTAGIREKCWIPD